LTAAGVEARYFELDSDLGHSSSGPEHAKMVAGFARVPGAVGRPAELRRFEGAVSPRSDEGPIRRAIDANLAPTRQRRQ